MARGVPLQPEKEAQLEAIAAQRGLKADELAQQVLTRYREDDALLHRSGKFGLQMLSREGLCPPVDHQLPFLKVYSQRVHVSP